MEIIPAILTNDPNELNSLISQAEGAAKRIQIDIIDGVFVENKTIDPLALENIETDLLLDFHLMTKEPIDWVEKCVTAQADRIIGQVEKMRNQLAFIGKVQEVGAQCGLGLDLKTPVGFITSQAFLAVDVILVMSVPAGWGGQEFDKTVFTKIKELDQIRKKVKARFSICVDGGVKKGLLKALSAAGVNEVAIGKSIFEGDLRQNLANLSSI